MMDRDLLEYFIDFEPEDVTTYEEQGDSDV